MNLNHHLFTKSEGPRNLAKRLLAALPAMGLLLALLFLAPWYVAALLVVVFSLLGLAEFRGLLGLLPRAKISFAPLAAGALLIGGGAALLGERGLYMGFGVAALLVIGNGLLQAGSDRFEAMQQVGLGMFGLIWIPWFLDHLILVLQRPDGRSWIIFLLLVLVCNDTLAYLVGSFLGRHPLLPAVSPSKTMEGSLGGLGGSMLGALIAYYWVLAEAGTAQPLPYLLGLSLVLGLLGQGGDLLESLLKRACGAKDSGTFLPGHGGVLDRMDAFLLSPPLLFHYLLLTSA